MSPTIHHKCKYFHSAAQRAKDRRQKFHFCRLQFDVRPLNGKLNLSIVCSVAWEDLFTGYFSGYFQSLLLSRIKEKIN